MLYVPKVNCMYLRYRDAFTGRTFLLLLLEKMYKGKQLSLVTFPIYIGNVTPQLALSLKYF